MAEGPLLLSCVGVATDGALLPHFLDHYRALGVDPADMHLILNASGPEAAALEAAVGTLRAFGCPAPEIWTDPYTSGAMWERRRALQDRVAPPGRWVLSADVDEYHEYPEPLGPFLARCAAMGVDCVQGVFVDRLAPGGKLGPVAPAPGVLAQFPVIADVGRAIGGRGAHHDLAGTVKVMAMRGHVRPSRGGHHPVPGQRARHLYRHPLAQFPAMATPAGRFAVPTWVHHVHWTDSLPARLRTRLATPGVSPAGGEYGRKQLAHLERHGGIDPALLDPGPGAIPPGWEGRLARLRREGAARAALAALRRAAGRMLGR